MINKKTVTFWIFVISAFLLTRLINLLIIPIFTDEAIYSYWAQVALHDPANRFISLEDGKQPLFIWLAALLQKIISDPLVATRIVSVISGLASTILIYHLSRTLFNEKVAKISSILYIILPFTLLYDRLALYDSLLTSFCLLSAFLTVKMTKNPRLDLALLNGFAIGLGMITKSSAQFFLYLLPFSLLLFDFKNNTWTLKLVKWGSFSAITAILSLVIYNSLRVSPLFYMIGRKNHEFIRSFSQVIADPFTHFSGNIQSMVKWLFQYNGPLLIILIVVMVYGLIKFEKKIWLLSVYILAPFFAEALFNQILYPRFSLFYFPFIIILIAYGIIFLTQKIKKGFGWGLFLVFLIYPLISSFLLIVNPPSAQIADSDKTQYINGWSAGYGVSQTASFLKEQSQNQKVYVGTEGTFGLLPFGLQVYFFGSQNIKFVGYWPVNNIPEQVLTAAKSQKTYFIYYQNPKLPLDGDLPNLKLIAKYRQGSGNSFLRLYEVSPK